MILLKIIFLILDLSVVITFTIDMIKDDDICRKIAYTIIIIGLLLMWLYILVI